MALIAAIKVQWKGELIPETAPRGDKNSNGSAESAVKSHENMTRTYKLALEGRIGRQIPDEAPIMEWLCEWAGTMHRRYRISERDGRTAFHRCRGKSANRPIVEFGERVLAQELLADPSARRNMEPRFEDGIVIGLLEESDELLSFILSSKNIF